MLEKAYCEYRLNRIQEAYQTLQNVDLNKMSAKELLGQVVSFFSSWNPIT